MTEVREPVRSPGPEAEWRLREADWLDEEAVALRAAMDEELGARYADRRELSRRGSSSTPHAARVVDPATIVATVLVFDGRGRAVGHGALRLLREEHEVKRVYIAPEARGRGASTALMCELERIARERGAPRVILQTGDRQPEAVALYRKLGYGPIPVYPPYLELGHSHCFGKTL